MAGGPQFHHGKLHPSRLESNPVLESCQEGGGLADDRAALFPSKDDSKFKELVAILRKAKRSLESIPRIGML
jgi:hypothetical protein